MSYLKFMFWIAVRRAAEVIQLYAADVYAFAYDRVSAEVHKRMVARQRDAELKK